MKSANAKTHIISRTEQIYRLQLPVKIECQPQTASNSITNNTTAAYECRSLFSRNPTAPVSSRKKAAPKASCGEDHHSGADMATSMMRNECDNSKQYCTYDQPYPKDVALRHQSTTY